MGFKDDLISSSKSHSSRVILGLDVTGPQQTRVERAVKLLGDLGDEIAAIKVHWHLILPGGLDGMREVIRVSGGKGLPIIADFKLNDIESTNIEAVDLLYTSGISAVIANPFIGAEEGLSQVISKAKKLGKGVLLLVYMSHAGAREGYGLIVDGKPLYLDFARRVRDWDADGAIVSAKSPSIIREVRTIIRKDQIVVSPGVGVQGGEAAQAVSAGADFVIIGRSIIEAPDPKKVLRSFNLSAPLG